MRRGRRPRSTILHEVFFTGTGDGRVLTSGEIGILTQRPFRVVSCALEVTVDTATGTSVALTIALTASGLPEGSLASRSILAAHGAINRVRVYNPNRLWSQTAGPDDNIIGIDSRPGAANANVKGIARILVEYGPSLIAGLST